MDIGTAKPSKEILAAHPHQLLLLHCTNSSLEDYVELREPLLKAMVDNGIKGTLLIAEEGINGTVSGSREGIDGLMAWLRNDPRMVDIDHKESYCDDQPFYRTKVKLKKEIVTLGVEGVDPNKKVGTYVDPENWIADQGEIGRASCRERV